MSVLRIADVADYCKVSALGNVEMLQDTLDAAEAWVANKAGYLTATTVTERIPGNTGTLALRRPPVLTLTSVTARSGSVIALGDLYLDTRQSVVTHNAGTEFSEDWYTVVYSSGLPTPLPANVAEAVRVMTFGYWQATQRGAQKQSRNDPAAPEMSYEAKAERLLHGRLLSRFGFG